ncbi:MAG: acetyl-CoA C-acetyltransferase [Gammaproteobacteria bacterium]|nr:acetyl-CoA C-acetyltransferase [Gammaproteobacteria bacterium]MBM4224213.1 acetyl-CoA C-acetyltransferase [Gammaproteobacteria bacterium]
MLVGAAARRVAVIGGARIPFARSHGAYAQIGNLQMLTAALQAVVAKYGLNGLRLGEVAAGAVIKHSRDFNLARESVLGTTLDPHTPAFDVQRACGTSLEAAIGIANKIALRQIDCGLAGGVDTVSDPPIVYPRAYQQILMRAFRAKTLGGRLVPFFSLRPGHLKPLIPDASEPRTGLSMGESCEQMAKRWGISREAQDALACNSHRHAAAAWQSGFFDDLVVPFEGLQRDDNVRADSTHEKLAKLRPSFARSGSGTLTAGNSTPLTDGASAVLLASEPWARAHNLPVQAWLTFGKAWAVDFVSGAEGLLMAPAYSVPAMLEDAGLGLQDFDFFEIHEAFAAQVLCTLAAWESAEWCRDKLGRGTALGSIDRSKLNVKGSSVAIGHPFAATGARIVATLAKLLATNPQSRRGLISVCTAGGMGVTAILERA